MIGVDGDQIGPLVKSYRSKGGDALLGMMRDWAQSVQAGTDAQPEWSIGEESAMLAMREIAPGSSSLPVRCVVESFNRIAEPLADYVLERFPGLGGASRTYPGTCAGYKGSLPRPEQRKNLAAEIILILGNTPA